MNSKALARALEINKHYPYMDKKSKRSVFNELAAFGFTPQDAAVIMKSKALPWNIKTLDALVIIASRYNMDGYISPVLLPKVIQGGTPLRHVVRLTGIPIEELRDVLESRD